MDARIRELERRWHLTGGIEDEAALLREQVRAGLLAKPRLAAAAHCGHPAARLALGVVGRTESLREWVIDGFGVLGKEPLVRVAVAAARLVYPVWAGEFRPEVLDSEWVTRALRAAEAWVVAPSTRRARAARDAASLAEEAVYEAELSDEDSAARAARACGFAAQTAWLGRVEDAWAGVELAALVEGEDAVRRAALGEVVPWGVGRGDPVAERVGRPG